VFPCVESTRSSGLAFVTRATKRLNQAVFALTSGYKTARKVAGVLFTFSDVTRYTVDDILKGYLMTATTGTIIRTRTRTKPLWIAVGFLSAAVIGLAGTMIYMQARPHEVKAVLAPSGMIEEKDLAMLSANPATGSAARLNAVQDEVEKPAAVKKAPPPAKVAAAPKPAPKPTVKAAPEPVVAAASPAPTPMPAPVIAQAPAAKPVCVQCGTVESATPIMRAAPASGVGVVAGGAVGAVLGNQVGGGSGKTAATILGAVGGGWAGNEIEKRMKKETVYEVKVRMDNESTRTFELAGPVAAGSKVTAEGNSLRLADGSIVSPLPRPQPQTQTGSSPYYTGG
jgi:outer membrane lipoprotein SlyB